MMCTKCEKEVLDCECDNAIERLLWLVSDSSPMLFSRKQLELFAKRILELQGLRELKNIGKSSE